MNEKYYLLVPKKIGKTRITFYLGTLVKGFGYKMIYKWTKRENGDWSTRTPALDVIQPAYTMQVVKEYASMEQVVADNFTEFL